MKLYWFISAVALSLLVGFLLHPVIGRSAQPAPSTYLAPKAWGKAVGFTGELGNRILFEASDGTLRVFCACEGGLLMSVVSRN